MDRTHILIRLAQTERYRLEILRMRSRGFRFLALIPLFPFVLLTEVLVPKARDSVRDIR